MKRKSRWTWSLIITVMVLVIIGVFFTSQEASAMNPHFFGQSSTWHSSRWGSWTTGSSVSPPPSTAIDTPTSVAVTLPASSPQSVSNPPSAPAVTAGAGQRAVTLTNNTQQTVWAVSTGNPGYTPPDGGQWTLAPGQSTTVIYPSTWNGRIWGRTGCNFDGAGQGSCQTGDCGNGASCPNVAGMIPASLAEFNMQGAGIDYYDVSLVDAFNLPITINVVSGQMGVPANVTCVTAACATNLDSASVCPAVLQVKDAGGNIVACDSACTVLHQDQYCCANAYATPATCNPTTWPVNYAAVFKQAVPYAYSYPFDDATSVFTCVNNCSYQIVFG
jgi:hypothetical protein